MRSALVIYMVCLILLALTIMLGPVPAPGSPQAVTRWYITGTNENGYRFTIVSLADPTREDVCRNILDILRSTNATIGFGGNVGSEQKIQEFINARALVCRTLGP